MLGSVRNVPFLIWDETTDELVPIAGVLKQIEKLDASATATSSTSSRRAST